MAWWRATILAPTSRTPRSARRRGCREDKFVPWQKLQMGGTAMRRGTFTERRPAASAAMPDRSADGAKNGPANRPGIAGAEPKAGGSAAASGAETTQVGRSKP